MSWAQVEGARAAWWTGGDMTHEVLPGEGAGHGLSTKGHAALLVCAVEEAWLRRGRAPRGPRLRPRQIQQAVRPSCAATRPGLRLRVDTGGGGKGRGHERGRTGVLSMNPQERPRLGGGSNPELRGPMQG